MGFEISWSSEFETGIDIIDQQHRRLFDYFAEIEAVVREFNAIRERQSSGNASDFPKKIALLMVWRSMPNDSARRKRTSRLSWRQTGSTTVRLG